MGRSRNATFTILAGLLFMLVALAAIFILMLAPKPRGGAQPQVGTPQAVACPIGSHAPVCYQATVTNEGSGSGAITCQVSASAGDTAMFANESDTYTTPAGAEIPPNGSFVLSVLSKPAAGAKTVSAAPTVTCQGVS